MRFDRQRQQQAIERAGDELVDQHARLRLAHLETQRRIAPLQQRQHARQQIRRQSRDDAELQRAAEDVAMAGEVDEVAGGGEDALGALRHLKAGFGDGDLARPALDQLGAELALELADLHRQRRLGDGALLRRLAEMAIAGEGGEITQLTQGNHGLILAIS